MLQPVKAGDTINVQYTGKFEDGVVFDSSEGKEPLKFTVGKGQLIKGFDSAVVGMLKGDKKTVTIPPEEGYGPYMEDRVVDMPKDKVPEGMEVKVDMMVQLNDQAGNPMPARVVEITDTVVKLDMNNPLAGKTLIFDIEVVETGLESDEHQCGDGASGCGSCCGGCGA